VFGQGTLDNEAVIAAEAGWRGRFNDAVSLDVALYHNDYDDVRLRSFDPVTFLDTYTNAGTGSAKGVEVAVDVKATERWTLRGAWSYHMGQHQPRGEDPDIDFVDSQYPVHLINLRSYLDLGNAWELDTAAYVVERFEELGGGDGPEYWRGDIRLGWRPKDGVRVAFGVQGVNDSFRSEFGAEEARRLFYVSLDLVR
jgi:iron complex outermembrane recepter protein